MRLCRAFGIVLLLALPAFAEEKPDVPGWIKVSTRESGQGPVLELVLRDGSKRSLKATADAGLIAYLPEGAFGRRTTFGLDEYGWNAGLIRFDLAGLKDVKSARLVLHYAQSGLPISKPLRVGLYRLAGPFDETGTTWENAAAFGIKPDTTLTFQPSGARLEKNVTAAVQAALKRQAFHGWILQSLKQRPLPAHRVVRPGKKPAAPAKSRTMPQRKGAKLIQDLLGLVEWQPDAAAAVAKAKADKKLALALVRASFNAQAPNDNEEIFLAATFANPVIHKLVGEHFVPTRIFYPGWTYTYGKVREPDPLKALGTSAADVKPFALVVADADGKHIGTQQGMGTFDADQTAAFLEACLERAGRPVTPEDWADEDSNMYWAAVESGALLDPTWDLLSKASLFRLLVRGWKIWPERMAMYATVPHVPVKRREDQSRSAFEAQRATTYLLRTQGKDGSWPTAQTYAANIPGVTALCARALHIWAPRAVRKAHGAAARAAVAKARDWCLRWMKATDPEVANSFGTTYVLDFFLDLYAADPKFKLQAQKAVAFHERGQAPNGGWGYSRKFAVGWRGGFGGWPVTDKGRVHSMNTGPALLALARAKQAGLKVSDEVLEKGTRALLAMKDGPAVFTYTWPEPRNFNKLETSIGRACGCEHALVELGAAKDQDLEHAVATFLQHREGLRKAAKVSPGWMPPHAVSSYFYFFAYHHAARAIRRLPEDQRAKRLALLRDDLLGCVEADGTWVDYLGVGKPYGTAMALMILAWAP